MKKEKTKPDSHNRGKLIVNIKLWDEKVLVKMWSVVDDETILWDRLQDAREYAEKNDFDEGIWCTYPNVSKTKTKKTKLKGGRV